MLEIAGLSVHRRGRLVLHDISVRIGPGLTLLAGVNGSGKSTLIHCLEGLVVYSGSIILDHQDVRSQDRATLAGMVATVFQTQRQMIPMLAEEYVLTGRFRHLRPLRGYNRQDLAAVQAAMADLEALHLTGRKTHQLSGGEMQLLTLARAVAQDTPVLLLDEPGQHLDPAGRDRLYRHLLRLGDQGRIILCVTHDLEPLSHPGARVIGLRDGRIAWDHPSGHNPADMLKTLYGISPR
ncbi:MAG: ABC transporter ATP-binding protein [Bacteroidia bacterium]|nr:ABC transporter ATP-binding protein [Bacteroidia bacterium]